MALYQRSFTVRGAGEFPLDMLRYDRCWPNAGDDVEAILPRYGGAALGALATREVRLCKFAHTKRGPYVEEGRWTSFGWTVIEQEFAT